jgi:hypothetical protein
VTLKCVKRQSCSPSPSTPPQAEAELGLVTFQLHVVTVQSSEMYVPLICDHGLT